jgi:protein ImuA
MLTCLVKLSYGCPPALKKAHIIAKLQKEILLLGGIKAPAADICLSNGPRFLRQHVPKGVFSVGALHEFLCAEPEDIAVTAVS